MGFFNKLRKQLRKSIRTGEAPVMPRLSRASRPIGEMPLTPEQMARKAEYERNKAIENERNVISKYGSRENMERMVKDSFSGLRGNMGSDFRMPQNRGFTGLSGLFRRLQQQIRNQQMRIPQPIPELRAGEIMPNSPVLDRRPSPPRMPAPPIAVPPGIIPNLVKKQIQQPQMQSFGRPQLPFQGGFMPEMRAGGGGIDKAIYDLKFKLNG